jgi:hypothetical protein
MSLVRSVPRWSDAYDCTYIKIAKQTSCAVLCCTLFRHVRRMSPIPPMVAVMVAIIDSDFWNQDVFTANVPLCRSQRSITKTVLKVTTVTAPIAMKRGCRLWAPTSEIYLLPPLLEDSTRFTAKQTLTQFSGPGALAPDAGNVLRPTTRAACPTAWPATRIPRRWGPSRRCVETNAACLQSGALNFDWQLEELAGRRFGQRCTAAQDAQFAANNNGPTGDYR